MSTYVLLYCSDGDGGPEYCGTFATKEAASECIKQIGSFEEMSPADETIQGILGFITETGAIPPSKVFQGTLDEWLWLLLQFDQG